VRSGKQKWQKEQSWAKNLFAIFALLALFASSSASLEKRAVLASEHFRISFPADVARREVERLLGVLEAAHRDLSQRLEKAGLKLGGNAPIELFAHASTGDFIAATGKAGWLAAVTRGRRIELQPLATLQKRGLLATTLKHELAHVFIEGVSKGAAPRWLAEGLALHFAGEGRVLAQVKLKTKLSREELESRLARVASATEMRELYAAAYREVRALLQAEGEAGTWRQVAQSGKPRPE
jgi:hypothetical protein